MRNMIGKIGIAVVFLLLSHLTEAGSPCPGAQNILPCACSNSFDDLTSVVCAGIQNQSKLEQATKGLKSLFVDHLLMINIFTDGQNLLDENEVDSNETDDGMFPKRWLSELRVIHLDIQNSKLNGYFMVDDVLKGQGEFLNRLTINNARLRGHLCSSCGPSSNTIAFSTNELRKTPLLLQVDLSHNKLNTVDGNAFPPVLNNLMRVILSNNHITRVNDNAFSNLRQLFYLDLSRNRLTSFSKKIFRSSDNSLSFLDLSYNSIHTLSDVMFATMSALKEVRLGHNSFETLPETTWAPLPTLLEKIDVRGNFLICNCSMKWISRRMSKTTKLIGQCIGSKHREFFDLKPTLPSITSCSS